MVLLNKKEYQEHFEEFHHEEYFNLKLYPEAGILEHEAGILSHVASLITPCVYHPNGKESQFFIDNLKNFYESVGDCEEIIIGHDENSCDIMLTDEPNSFEFQISFPFTTKKLCMKSHLASIVQHVKEYEDNLICLCMIVKDAGPGFEKVLTENIPNFDEWCILDTGSTDGTQDVIRKVLANKRGQLFEEPFINFRDSRNRCLELAGTSCKFLLTLDDTYVVQGNLRSFLHEVRGDQFSDSFSLLIKSNDSEYYSNRIIKSLSGLRYKYTIHEVIPSENNINVTIPANRAIILDYRSDYMETRTNDRKQFDLDLLYKEYEESPDDPRALYYIAQTYGCMGNEKKKAEYFEKRVAHPHQGYIQEKIDALFELARCYNFKLEGHSWEKCEKLYLQAWELDKTRPDSLYFLGIHWYLEKNFTKAYEYFKPAFHLGYPIHSQYSLKPTLSFHFLPKFLAEICYYMRDFHLGHQACDFFLKNNKSDADSWNMMTSWMSIYNQLIKMPPVKEPTNLVVPLVIVTDGGWTKWTGRDILTKGFGGSETWVIEMARNISDTIVFCNCECEDVFEGTRYIPIEQFHSFVTTHTIENCIISRFTEYVPVALQGHCNNVGIIFHDLLSPELIIPLDSKIKWIFCLTDWHTEYITEVFPQFKNIIQTLNYGIDTAKFLPIQKIPRSFIYSSFPTRGLVILLRMWPRILKKFSDATLNVYCDLEHEWSNRVSPDEMIEIKSIISQKGIINHGWVSKDVIYSRWSQTEYWLYPCTFQETFCMTALEAAASKTFVISNNLAALRDTIGDRGLIVHGDPNTIEWQNLVLENLERNESLVDKNYEWARSLSWSKQALLLQSKMINYFDMDNWTNINMIDGNNMFSVIKLLPNKSNILEIGTFVGTSIIKMLELVPESTATVIDKWEDYNETDYMSGNKTSVKNASKSEVIFNDNIKKSGMESRIQVIKGNSSEKLFNLELTSFDFIYIDGSHKCLDVYLDAVLAWRLLRKGGILGFDDYLFNKDIILQSPYDAINYFLECNPHEMIHKGYRVFIRKPIDMVHLH